MHMQSSFFERNVHKRDSFSHLPTAQTTLLIFSWCIFWLCEGQVDWAALAQAWIAQKESTGTEQQNVQPNGQDIPGLEPVGQSNHGAFQGEPAFGRMWQPGTCVFLLNHSEFLNFLIMSFLHHCSSVVVLKMVLH